MRYNEFEQPIGDALPDFQRGELPTVTLLQGRYCRLEKLSQMKHGEDLFTVYSSPKSRWTYIPLQPFDDKTQFDDFLLSIEQSNDPYFLRLLICKQVSQSALLR